MSTRISRWTCCPICRWDSDELLEVPWVVFERKTSGDPTNAELRNIGRYLTSGGFMFTEIGIADIGSRKGNNWGHWLFNEALATQGVKVNRHYTWEPLPNSHPIYHAFFDFDGLPSLQAAEGQITSARTTYRTDYMEGIELEGQLVLTNQEKGIISSWRRFYVDGGWDLGPRRDRQDKRQFFKFGINTIVFALTQEGSIAQQVLSGGR